MKVDNTAIEALLQQQEQTATRRTGGDNSAFEAALAQEMGTSEAVAAAGMPPMPGANRAGLISRMLLGNTEESSALSPDEAVFEEAFSQASGALDLWDSYTQALGSSRAESSLRDAYALLEGIDSTVSNLRKDTSSLRGQNPGFDSLLNELEILTTTEKIKFNRGDYLA